MNQQSQNFSNQEPKSITPRLVLYVILLFTIPPIGLYLLWRNKACHKWFPHLLLISGGYWLTLSIVFLGQWISVFSEMIQEFGIETRALSSIRYVFIVVFVLQIISGLLIDKKISFVILTPKNYSVIAIIFLCIDFLIFPIAIGSTLVTVQQPLYQKLGEIGEPPGTITPETKEIKTMVGIDILSPVGGEQWAAGEVHSIIWEQWGLIDKKVKICLLANDDAYQPILVKEGYQGACSDFQSQIGKGEEIFAFSGKYDWGIPKNLTDRFWNAPYSYRIKIMPPEELEPEISFTYGFSDYFEISGKEM